MSKRVILGCLMAMAVGCNNTPTTTGNDAGGTGNDSGTGGTDSGGGGTDGGSTATPADYTCAGQATLPAGGAATMATLQLNEYLVSSTPIGNTMVDVWLNGVIGADCAGAGADCLAVTTDATGAAMVTAPAGGAVAYHIHESAATAEVLAYGMRWTNTAGDTVRTAGFASSTIGTVSALLQRQFQADTAGAISGQVADCAGDTVTGAEARVFMGTTQITTGTGNTSPRITGLSGTSPTRNGLTGAGGTFVGANVPAGTDYHVEIWYAAPNTTDQVLVGCEEGQVVAGGITVLGIGPLRSDYEAGSACAAAAAANP